MKILVSYCSASNEVLLCVCVHDFAGQMALAVSNPEFAGRCGLSGCHDNSGEVAVFNMTRLERME